MLALKASAALMWLVAAGFGIPAPFVASYLLRERTLPGFMGLFPMYGRGMFERFSPVVFAVLIGLFTALCALEALAGWLLWHGEQLGALITIALLPIEVVFWGWVRSTDPAADRDRPHRPSRGRLVGYALKRCLLWIAARQSAASVRTFGVVRWRSPSARPRCSDRAADVRRLYGDDPRTVRLLAGSRLGNVISKVPTDQNT